MPTAHDSERSVLLPVFGVSVDVGALIASVALVANPPLVLVELVSATVVSAEAVAAAKRVERLDRSADQSAPPPARIDETFPLVPVTLRGIPQARTKPSTSSRTRSDAGEAGGAEARMQVSQVSVALATASVQMQA